MNIRRFRYIQDWDAGSYNGAFLDTTTNVGPYQHPSVTPGGTITSQRGDSGAALALATASPGTRALTGSNLPSSLSFGNVYSAVPSAAVNLYFDAATTGGTFILAVNDALTGAITYSTTAATTVSNVQTALNTLLGAGNVTVASVSAFWYTLTFGGTYAARPVCVAAQNSALTTSGMAVVPPWIVSPTWTNLDQFAVTQTAGDYYQFTTPATCQRLTLYLAGTPVSGAGNLAGINMSAPATTPAHDMTANYSDAEYLTGVQSGTLRSGQIRNGAITIVQVDGVTKATVDTYQSTTPLTLYGLTGSNVIRVYHSGSYNGAIAPYTTPQNSVNTGGSNVAGHLSLAVQLNPSFITAGWQIVIVDASHWKIQRNTGTPESPSYSDVSGATSIAIGSSDTTHIPGLSVTVPSGPTYTAGDSATFRTDATMLAISAVVMSLGTSAAAGVYTSPVIDSGDAQTQWFLAEWTEPSGSGDALTVGGFSFSVGNTPTVDASWSSHTVTPVDTLLSTSEQRGTAGLVGPVATAQTAPLLPRGRYAQFGLTFASNTVPPWVRNLSLYYGRPESEPVVLPMLGLAPAWQMGADLGQWIRTIACFLAMTRAVALDYQASAAIGGAIDQWLQSYGADVGLTEYTGIPPSGFQSIVQAFLRSHSNGGSTLSTQQLVALLVLGPTGAASAITLTTTGAWTYTLTIPPPSLIGSNGQTYYPGLPGVPTGPSSLARTIISTFVGQINPAGNVPTVTFL